MAKYTIDTGELDAEFAKGCQDSTGLTPEELFSKVVGDCVRACRTLESEAQKPAVESVDESKISVAKE